MSSCVITDFRHGEDKFSLYLGSSGMTFIADKVAPSSGLWSFTFYNTETGELTRYRAAESHHAAETIMIATLTNKPTLDMNDFVIT